MAIARNRSYDKRRVSTGFPLRVAIATSSLEPGEATFLVCRKEIARRVRSSKNTFSTTMGSLKVTRVEYFSLFSKEESI